jgi:hypothetical protein
LLCSYKSANTDAKNAAGAPAQAHAAHETVSCRQLLKALKTLHLSQQVCGKDLVHAMRRTAATDLISYRDFVQYVSWECAGLAADAWNPTSALEAARGEKKKVLERVRVHVQEVAEEEEQRRQAKQAHLAQLASGTLAAKDELAALRKLAKNHMTAKKKIRATTEKEKMSLPPLPRQGPLGLQGQAQASSGRCTLVESGGGSVVKMSQTMPAAMGMLHGGASAAARMMARNQVLAAERASSR